MVRFTAPGAGDAGWETEALRKPVASALIFLVIIAGTLVITRIKE